MMAKRKKKKRAARGKASGSDEAPVASTAQRPEETVPAEALVPPEEPAPKPARRRIPALSLALVLLAALLPYLNSLDNGFVLEDRELVLANPQVRGAASLGALFTQGQWREDQENRFQHYRPLATASLALNHRLGGDDPRWYHLVNLLLHLLICALLLLLLRRLIPRGMLALAATLLFAAHPVHTEAVSAVAGRPHLLAALFLIAAWLVHLRSASRPRIGSLALGMVLYLLALLSHESTVMLLPLVILGDLLKPRPRPADPPVLEDDDSFYLPDRKTASGLTALPLSRYAGLAAALVGFLIVRHQVLGSLMGSGDIQFLDNPLATSETGVRLMTAVTVLGEYLRLLVWPVNLTTDYSFNQINLVTTPADPGFLAALVSCLALLGGAAVLWRGERGRRIAFGILFFFCAIAAVSNIPFAIDTVMAERLLYLPSVGFCLVLAALFCLAGCSNIEGNEDGTRVRRRRLVAFLVVVIAVGYGTRTLIRNRDWRNDRTLLGSAALVSPNSARVHCALGVDAFARGEMAQAEKSFGRALEIYGEYPTALYALGAVRLQTQQLQDAREVLARAVAVSPDYAGAWFALGVASFNLGHQEEATRSFRQALDLDPGNLRAMENLGICLGLEEQYDEAIALFHTILDRRPGDPGILDNLATHLELAGRLEEAAALQR